MLPLFAIAAALLSSPCLAQENPLVRQTEDIVRLEIGGEVRGRIVKETADYVEIRVADGMVVGFGKSKTVAILRAGDLRALTNAESQPTAVDSGASSLAADGAALPIAQRFRPGEQWYALHDGEGNAVGWLQEFVGVDADRSVRISEEWRFRSADGPTEITILERLDRDGSPMTCFYHERVRRPDGRVLNERVVRGVVRDGRLVVTRKSNDGSARYDHAFDKSARFPLEFRLSARRRGAGHATEVGRVYDPWTEDWTEHGYEVGEMREVERHGKSISVRILRHMGGATDGVANVEWLDGAGSCVRREVNGPALVAVPMTESSARAFAESTGEAPFDAALVPESGGRFALWLPNPLWRATSDRAGEILARCESMDATMSLVLLDQLDGSVLLETATDTVERWLRLAHPDIQFEARTETRVRGERAFRVKGAYEVRTIGSVATRRCDIVVFQSVSGGFLSFCSDAPKAGYTELAGDFERALSQLETRFEPDRRDGPVSRR